MGRDSFVVAPQFHTADTPIKDCRRMAQRVWSRLAHRVPSRLRGKNGPLLAVLLTVTGMSLILHNLNLHKGSTPPLETFTQRYSPLDADFLSRLFGGIMPSSTKTKAPGKKELGNAGWTLIHSIAANYPENPSESEQYHAKAFLRSIGKLYPCKTCRRHFSKFLAASPPELSSREAFMQWACSAHNSVNVRLGKESYPCDMEQQEARWGDCGCKKRK